MAHELNQSDWRRDRNVKDQWGRMFLIAFETGPGGQGGSNMPTGQIHPAGGWRDPLKTPAECFHIPLGEFGEPDRNKLVCEYDPWLKRQKTAEVDWKKRMNEIGMRQYKSAYDPKTAEEDDLLMSLAGPKPWPPSQAIERAMRGDKAMLGLAPLSLTDRELLNFITEDDWSFGGWTENDFGPPQSQMPPGTVQLDSALRSTAVVPHPRRRRALTYPKFVAKMKAEGITDPAEIRAHWQVYREERRAADTPAEGA